MKKEPLSIMIVKTLLAVIIFAGVGTIIVGGGWLIGKYGITPPSIIPSNNKNIVKELPDEWKVCSQDSDCIETQTDCCNCGNGGEQIGINKKYLKNWEDALKDKCQDIDCITLFNCKEGDVVCEDNKCEFREGIETNNPDIADWQTYRNEEFGFEVRYLEDDTDLQLKYKV